MRALMSTLRHLCRLLLWSLQWSQHLRFSISRGGQERSRGSLMGTHSERRFCVGIRMSKNSFVKRSRK